MDIYIYIYIYIVGVYDTWTFAGEYVGPNNARPLASLDRVGSFRIMSLSTLEADDALCLWLVSQERFDGGLRAQGYGGVPSIEERAVLRPFVKIRTLDLGGGFATPVSPGLETLTHLTDATRPRPRRGSSAAR